MRNIIRADGIPPLVSMTTSEHVVMQNEALVSLTLIVTMVLGTNMFHLCFGHIVYFVLFVQMRRNKKRLSFKKNVFFYW